MRKMKIVLATCRLLAVGSFGFWVYRVFWMNHFFPQIIDSFDHGMEKAGIIFFPVNYVLVLSETYCIIAKGRDFQSREMRRIFEIFLNVAFSSLVGLSALIGTANAFILIMTICVAILAVTGVLYLVISLLQKPPLAFRFVSKFLRGSDLGE